MRLVLVALVVMAGHPVKRPYHKVPLAQFASQGTKWTHVEVVGVVEDVFTEADGDTHIVLVPKLHTQPFAVAECIPGLPCTRPKKGSRVRVSGISRRDGTHNFWEIHPVESLSVY